MEVPHNSLKVNQYMFYLCSLSILPLRNWHPCLVDLVHNFYHVMQVFLLLHHIKCGCLQKIPTDRDNLIWSTQIYSHFCSSLCNDVNACTCTSSWASIAICNFYNSIWYFLLRWFVVYLLLRHSPSKYL